MSEQRDDLALKILKQAEILNLAGSMEARRMFAVNVAGWLEEAEKLAYNRGYKDGWSSGYKDSGREGRVNE